MKILPTGSRVLVRILSHEFQSVAGIIVPAQTMPGMPGGGEQGSSPAPTMKVCEVILPGEGKLNTTTGQFMGSRWKPGDKALLRHGISAIAHIDYIPGRANECMVQEDTLVARVEFDSDERPIEPGTGKKLSPVLLK